VGIWKAGIIYPREDGHTSKGNHNTIGNYPLVRKPKVHMIHLARHGRDGLVKSAAANRRTAVYIWSTKVRRVPSRVDIDAIDRATHWCPTSEVAGFKPGIYHEVLGVGREGRARENGDEEENFSVRNNKISNVLTNFSELPEQQVTFGIWISCCVSSFFFFSLSRVASPLGRMRGREVGTAGPIGNEADPSSRDRSAFD
jgi:hypothetical protein